MRLWRAILVRKSFKIYFRSLKIKRTIHKIRGILQGSIFLLFIPILFEGCSPLLTPGVADKMKTIAIPVIPEHAGQNLRALLYQSFQSQGETPAYFLAISFKNKDHRLEMGRDDRFHALESVLKLSYELIRMRDKKILDKDLIWVSTPKFLTSSPYGKTCFDVYVTDLNLEKAAHLLFERMALVLSREQ